MYVSKQSKPVQRPVVERDSKKMTDQYKHDLNVFLFFF